MRKNSQLPFLFLQIFLFMILPYISVFMHFKMLFISATQSWIFVKHYSSLQGSINPSNMLIHCSRNVLDFMLSVYKCKMFLESCTQNVLFTNLVNILFWDKGFYSKFKPVSHSATLSQSKLPVPDGELKSQWLVFDVETQNVSNCHESDHCKKHLLPLHSCISRRGIKGKWFLS